MQTYVLVAIGYACLALAGCIPGSKDDEYQPLPYYETEYVAPSKTPGGKTEPRGEPGTDGEGESDPEHENVKVPLPPALQPATEAGEEPDDEEDGENLGAGDDSGIADPKPGDGNSESGGTGGDDGGTDDGGSALSGGATTGGDTTDKDDDPKPAGPKTCGNISNTRMGKVIFQKEVPQCGYGGWDMGTHLAALSQDDFQEAKMCGACIRIDGPKGHTIAKVVDRCKFCKGNEIVMTEAPYAEISNADPWDWSKVTWSLVSCPVEGPLRYHYKFGSSPYWTAVQVRNARHPIKKLEFSFNGSDYTEPEFEDWNYYVEMVGMGKGPFTFRVTDMFDQTVVDKDVQFEPDSEFAGQSQFPICP